MAYSVNRTSSPASGITVADGVVDNTFDITLIGRGFINYGEILQENILHVMENFARNVAPSNPVPGQLWFNPNTSIIYVRTEGSVWLSLLDPATGTIDNSHIKATAQIDISKLATATAAQMIVANPSGIPTYRNITGDVTIDSLGVTNLEDNTVGVSNIQNQAVQTQHLDASIHISTLSASSIDLIGFELSDDDHGSRSGGSLHPDATGSISGFMSAADKSKLDSGTGLNSEFLNGQNSAYYRNATNLNAGTLPAARFNDTAHGNRGGGALHADVTTSVDGFMSSSDKTKLDGIAPDVNLEAYSQSVISSSLASAAAQTFTITHNLGTDDVWAMLRVGGTVEQHRCSSLVRFNDGQTAFFGQGPGAAVIPLPATPASGKITVTLRNSSAATQQVRAKILVYRIV